jgi:hypothetical protein
MQVRLARACNSTIKTQRHHDTPSTKTPGARIVEPVWKFSARSGTDLAALALLDLIILSRTDTNTSTIYHYRLPYSILGTLGYSRCPPQRESIGA